MLDKPSSRSRPPHHTPTSTATSHNTGYSHRPPRTGIGSNLHPPRTGIGLNLRPPRTGIGCTLRPPKIDTGCTLRPPTGCKTGSSVEPSRCKQWSGRQPILYMWTSLTSCGVSPFKISDFFFNCSNLGFCARYSNEFSNGPGNDNDKKRSDEENGPMRKAPERIDRLPNDRCPKGCNDELCAKRTPALL